MAQNAVLYEGVPLFPEKTKEKEKEREKSMGVIEIVLMGSRIGNGCFCRGSVQGLAMRKVNMRQCFLIALFSADFRG